MEEKITFILKKGNYLQEYLEVITKITNFADKYKFII